MMGAFVLLVFLSKQVGEVCWWLLGDEVGVHCLEKKRLPFYVLNFLNLLSLFLSQ